MKNYSRVYSRIKEKLHTQEAKYIYCFLLVVGLFSSIELLGPLFQYVERGENVFNSLNVLLCAAFNAGIIILFLSFLHRFVYIGMIVFSIIYGCFCYANLLHFRGLGSYLPIEMITETQQLNGLASSILGLMRWYDVFFILIPAVIIFFFYRVKRKITIEFKWLRHFKVLAVFLLVTFPISLNGHKAIGLHFKNFPGRLIERGHLMPLDTYMKLGLSSLVYYQLYIKVCDSEWSKLSDQERIQVKEIIDSHLSANHSCVSENPKKNIVVMLLESFNTACIAPEIMPTLDSLCSLNTTLSCPNTNQLSQGAQSMGGQFVVLTGLSGLMNVPFCSICPYNVYPSIAKELKGKYDDAYSSVVVSTDRLYWRQSEVSDALGFDRVYGLGDGMTKRNRLSWGDDQEVFQMALSRIPTDGRAFCTVIVPSNMHADYTIDETINCSVDFARDYDAKCHEYFRRARYLDYQIADFIKGLKERGLYEETLIVVTSDHQVPPNFYSNSMKSALSPYFPTMFINTGCDWTENNEKNKDVVFCHSQAYPTMLLLMGLKPREYAGLFPPMTDIPASMEYEFDNCQYLTTNDARLKNIYHLQEKIIRSSYFGKK